MAVRPEEQAKHVTPSVEGRSSARDAFGRKKGGRR